MPITLQPVLHCDKHTASDMTVFQSRCGTVYEVYLGIALLERVSTDPEILQRKMLVGRLYNAKVSLRELSETFGHDPRTIKKWGEALTGKDPDVMVRAFNGRGGHGKVTDELIRYARQLYRERDMLGRNYRQIIIGRIKEVFQVKISSTLASRIFSQEQAAEKAAAAPSMMVTDAQPEPDLNSAAPASVNQSPTPLPAQTSDLDTGSEQLIHHAGQALFANEMKGFSDPLQRQFIGQILQGAINIEQSKTVCGKSLANFTGPVLSVLGDQRDGLNQQATPDAVLQVYALNSELLCDGPNRGKLFFFDPHTKECTGQLKLLKGWCGRRHNVTKALNMDVFHTRSSRPCFVQHHSPFYDMRERFFIDLALFDTLFDEDKRQGRTFLIDRGIYGLPTLRSFVKDYVITWEKDYSGGAWKDGHETVQFVRFREKNHIQDRHCITFQCQESVWKRDPAFRRIIVRVNKPGSKEIEVSVITSNPSMSVEDIVWAIFQRWLQENDFKYLDMHFGLNQLTSRDWFSFRDMADQFHDRPVSSPEYREIKKELQTLEVRLGRQLILQRRNQKQQIELESEQTRLEAVKNEVNMHLQEQLFRVKNDLPRRGKDPVLEAADCLKHERQLHLKMENNRKMQQKLTDEITAAETRIEPLEQMLCEAIRTESRLRLLIDGDYILLDTRKKSLMDALRISASNMFRNIQQQFRAIYDNFRDDHVLVRMLSRCNGTMTKTAHALIFKLWLPGALQNHRIKAFEQLLLALEKEINRQLAPHKPIRFKIATGPLNI